MWILAELLIEIVCSFFIEIVGYGVSRTASAVAPSQFETASEHKVSPALIAVAVYAVVGGAVGGLSLLVVPKLLTHGQTMQILNLVLSPFAVGAAVAILGGLREKSSTFAFHFDKFACGFVFGLSMAIVRFVWAR